MAALVVSTSLAGLGLAVAYAAVLFDAWGEYPVDARGNYLDSPYWVGMPTAAVYVTVVLQVAALVGYVAWLAYVAQHEVTRRLLLANLLFFVSSAAWPFAAYPFVRDSSHSLRRALVASLPLWSAAAGVLLLVVHTFETQYASPVPYVGILAVALVVVLADGVGWTATAIFRALKHNHTP